MSDQREVRTVDSAVCPTLQLRAAYPGRLDHLVDRKEPSSARHRGGTAVPDPPTRAPLARRRRSPQIPWPRPPVQSHRQTRFRVTGASARPIGSLTTVSRLSLYYALLSTCPLVVDQQLHATIHPRSLERCILDKSCASSLSRSCQSGDSCQHAKRQRAQLRGSLKRPGHSHKSLPNAHASIPTLSDDQERQDVRRSVVHVGGGGYTR